MLQLKEHRQIYRVQTQLYHIWNIQKKRKTIQVTSQNNKQQQQQEEDKQTLNIPMPYRRKISKLWEFELQWQFVECSWVTAARSHGKGAGGDGLSVRLLGGRGTGDGGRGQIHEPVGFFLYIVWDEAKDHTHLTPCFLV